jgi:biotin operon repressor
MSGAFVDEVTERRFHIIDRDTGEKVDVEDFLADHFNDVKNDKKNGFELSYPYKLFRFLETSENSKTRVLIHLLKIKNNRNLISETNRSIADDLGISKNTVNSVLKKLQDEGLLIRIRQGTYLLDPDVMVYGGKNAWRAKEIWLKKNRE